MPEIFTRFKNKKKRTVIFPLHEKRIDVGTPKILKKAKKVNSGFL